MNNSDLEAKCHALGFNRIIVNDHNRDFVLKNLLDLSDPNSEVAKMAKKRLNHYQFRLKRKVMEEAIHEEPHVQEKPNVEMIQECNDPGSEGTLMEIPQAQKGHFQLFNVMAIIFALVLGYLFGKFVG